MASTRFSQSEAPGRPRRFTSFIGREQEISAVSGLLARGDVRLVTLTGPGGIGKTRLAEQVLDRFGAECPDGSAIVDGAPIRDPDLVLPAIAEALGVPDNPELPLVARIHGFLADRQILLVLDNLEHLLVAVPEVVDLLTACPNLTILATSRVRLEVSGERVVPVSPLDLASARALFADRATALDPGFALAADLEPVVDAICARLDGLPLAIELAAARTPVLPPAALLARLERSLPLLSEGPRDAPERQRSMRDTIAWSHDLLTGRQQVLLRRLGVFVGGFTLEAASVVANDGGDCLSGMSTLVAASLVRSIPGVGNDPRFTLLETIREYALERLAGSGERDAIHARHARYFQELAEEALPHYDGPGLPLWNARIDRELDNCRAAIAWTIEHDDGVTGTRLAGALWRVWWYRQAAGGKVWIERVTEGRSWCERVLARWPDLPAPVMAEAVLGAGFLAANLGETERAWSAGESLLARSLAEDYLYGTYWAHHLLGALAAEHWQAHQSRIHGFGTEGNREGSQEKVRMHFEACLEAAPGMRNPENHAAMAYSWLGSAARSAGQIDEARQLLDRAVGLCRISGNPYILAQCLSDLGQLERALGHVQASAACLQEACGIAVKSLDEGDRHALLVEIAQLAVVTRRSGTAARLLAAADSLSAHLGYRGLFEATRDQARARLGEAPFDEAWQAGAAFTGGELMAEVDALLDDLAQSGDTRPDTHGLTAREVEVLRLVANGQSNRRIGETLSISERTVENHVFHILGKLNLDSRTAAATWAVRHGIV